MSFASGIVGGIGQGMQNYGDSLKKRMAQQNLMQPEQLSGPGSGYIPPALPDMPEQLGGPDMPNFYGAPMGQPVALTDSAPVDTSSQGSMLQQIMQDNPRDKYSKKKQGGGGGGDSGGMLKMIMSMFGGGGG